MALAAVDVVNAEVAADRVSVMGVEAGAEVEEEDIHQAEVSNDHQQPAQRQESRLAGADDDAQCATRTVVDEEQRLSSKSPRRKTRA